MFVIVPLVHRIAIPTPYAVGPVNCYLIDNEPVTLIDAGINTPEGHNALVLGLTECGLCLHSIERVLITHAHPDHYGLVHVIQEASGATVEFPTREIARVRDRQMVFEVGPVDRGGDAFGSVVRDGPTAKARSHSPCDETRHRRARA